MKRDRSPRCGPLRDERRGGVLIDKAGGGGYGDLKRDPAAIISDIAEGYVSSGASAIMIMTRKGAKAPRLNVVNNLVALQGLPFRYR